MTTLKINYDPAVTHVRVEQDSLFVVLADGRELSAPLAWFPRLRDATPKQRAEWQLIGMGEGVYWPDLDEDISVASLLGLPD